MKPFYIFILSIVIFVLPSKVFGIQAVVVHNVFYMPQDGKMASLVPYLEMYWQVNSQTILYKDDSGIWTGKIKTDIIIKQNGHLIKEDHYLLQTTPAKSGIEATNQKIIDLKRFALPPGKYSLQLSLTDFYKGKDGYTFSDTFSIAPVLSQPLISDIQLVDTIINSKERSVFFRNEHQQIPLCSNFLDDRKKTIHYYAELYNTLNIEKDKMPLILKTDITRKEQESVANNLTKEDTIGGNLLQIAEGEFSVATLASGNYYLNLTLKDKDNNILTKKSLFFQLLNTKPETSVVTTTKKENIKDDADAPIPVETLNLNKTFVAKYTSAQVRAILKMLKPIATPVEKINIENFLKSQDEIYMRYFIYNFWLNRNKLDPEQAWKNYSEIIKEVNKLFGSSILPGYESDRGIIYIKYGKPDERNIVSNEDGALPYELWQYNQLEKATNAVFLFYKYGFVVNDYRLLTSTVSGEKVNKGWRSFLYTNGVAQDPNNSKAEQYLLNR